MLVSENELGCLSFSYLFGKSLCETGGTFFINILKNLQVKSSEPRLFIVWKFLLQTEFLQQILGF